jgi:hypothetical protein
MNHILVIRHDQLCLVQGRQVPQATERKLVIDHETGGSTYLT